MTHLTWRGIDPKSSDEKLSSGEEEVVKGIFLVAAKVRDFLTAPNDDLL